MKTDITPFKVAIPSSELEDLKQRLARTRWPEKETCDDWSQGIPLDYTRNWHTTGRPTTTGGALRKSSTAGRSL